MCQQDLQYVIDKRLGDLQVSFFNNPQLRGKYVRRSIVYSPIRTMPHPQSQTAPLGTAIIVGFLVNEDYPQTHLWPHLDLVGSCNASAAIVVQPRIQTQKPYETVADIAKQFSKPGVTKLLQKLQKGFAFNCERRVSGMGWGRGFSCVKVPEVWHRFAEVTASLSPTRPHC